MKTSAIIPVKTFSKAKTRLNLEQACKEEICSLMLQEVLDTISNCKRVSKVVLVSKDEAALKIGRQFNAVDRYVDLDLASGLYLVKLTNSKGFLTKKIIIE